MNRSQIVYSPYRIRKSSHFSETHPVQIKDGGAGVIVIQPSRVQPSKVLGTRIVRKVYGEAKEEGDEKKDKKPMGS